MLAGQLPWRARSGTGLLQAHLVYAPAPLPPIDAMPAQFAELCMSCLAKNPHERPTSEKVANALSPSALAPYLLADPHPAARGAAPRGPRRARWARTLLLAGGFAGGIAIAGSTAPQWPRPNDDVRPAPAAAAAPTRTPTSAPTAISSGTTANSTAQPSTQPGEQVTITPAASQSPPTTAPTATTAPLAGYEITALGGLVRVSSDGATARVLSVSPTTGYTITD
jgi:serine/threonine-protein kinase